MPRPTGRTKSHHYTSPQRMSSAETYVDSQVDGQTLPPPRPPSTRKRKRTEKVRELFQPGGILDSQTDDNDWIDSLVGGMSQAEAEARGFQLSGNEPETSLKAAAASTEEAEAEQHTGEQGGAREQEEDYPLKQTIHSSHKEEAAFWRKRATELEKTLASTSDELWKKIHQRDASLEEADKTVRILNNRLEMLKDALKVLGIENLV